MTETPQRMKGVEIFRMLRIGNGGLTSGGFVYIYAQPAHRHGD